MSNMHPVYNILNQEWLKWRLTYNGGRQFIETYLKKYSRRESEEDFETRKELTYVPAFASSAVEEIKNSIFQRLVDISRIGGAKSYLSAVGGNEGGVDSEGTDMNTFIGESVIIELLTMAKVGIFVDMDSEVSNIYDPNSIKHPYIYTYCTEDILNWKHRKVGNQIEYIAIELQDYDYKLDELGMPMGQPVSSIRKMWIGADGFVHAKIGDGAEQILKITKIPFVCLEISNSLLVNVSGYQIALMNLASSDLMYALQSNFPFYTEQASSINFPNHLTNSGTGTEAGAKSPKDPNEIKVGHTVGRIYGQGMDRPDFINPSPDPLKVSMEKQNQLKSEIRELVNLALSNLRPKMASAESKSLDTRGMEAGLSYIALELQRGERQIAEFWAMYESTESATVNYPQLYMLKTDQERWDEAEKLAGRIKDAPSLTFKKEICKKITRIMLGGRVTEEVLQKIESEIDKVTCIINDPQMLLTNLENGVLDLETAAISQGIPNDSPKKAAQDHAERLARISTAQGEVLGNTGNGGSGAARGVADTSSSPGDAKSEKVGTSNQGTPTRVGRGAGR